MYDLGIEDIKKIGWSDSRLLMPDEYATLHHGNCPGKYESTDGELTHVSCYQHSKTQQEGEPDVLSFIPIYGQHNPSRVITPNHINIVK